MSLAKTQFVLLTEDEQQQNFVYHYLRECGVNPRRIRKVPLPAGSQAGEQYVRQQFQKEVKAHRSIAGSVTTALITVIDADTEPLEKRLKQLEDALKSGGSDRRSSAERLPILIPKRNIETWIHYLDGHPVDETTDYKPKSSEQVRRAGQHFAGWCQAPVPLDAPPSLALGRQELQRLGE